MKIKYWTPTFYNKQKGRSLIGWIVLTPFILLGLAIVLIIIGILLCETNKAYWDYKVKKMCEEDGGVTVYERVELTMDEYKLFNGIKGTIPVPGENSSIANQYRYLAKRSHEVIRSSNPNVTRYESIIYRSDDRKELGKMVTYYRSGGDFPTIIGHPTGFSCADIPNFNLDTEHQIFSIKGWQQ